MGGIIKINRFKSLLILLLITFSLFIFDNFKIGKYIGYKRVKDYMQSEINVYKLAKCFYGDYLDVFYNYDLKTANLIIDSELYMDGTLYYTTSNLFYSSYVGTVIYKDETSIKIATENNIINIAMLQKVNVNLYQKIEVDMVLAYLNKNDKGYYFYVY